MLCRWMRSWWQYSNLVYLSLCLFVTSRTCLIHQPIAVLYHQINKQSRAGIRGETSLIFTTNLPNLDLSLRDFTGNGGQLTIITLCLFVGVYLCQLWWLPPGLPSLRLRPPEREEISGDRESTVIVLLAGPGPGRAEWGPAAEAEQEDGQEHHPRHWRRHEFDHQHGGKDFQGSEPGQGRGERSAVLG